MPKNDYERYVESGYYLPTSDQGSDIDPSGNTVGQIEGVDQDLDESEDHIITLLEMHVYDYFDEEESEVGLPYVTTIDYDNDTIVSIRRNWNEEDEKKLKREWFVSYKFLPGLGFYGFGLYHVIGGLGKAATGSLRALLDSAAFSNMQGGFKL